MKASEVIDEIQKFIDRKGDKEFSVYLSFTNERRINMDIFYDDKSDDICIGVYA